MKHSLPLMYYGHVGYGTRTYTFRVRAVSVFQINNHQSKYYVN